MTVDRIDPYAALGLTPNATQGHIRRAYRTLLRQNHPDTRALGEPADEASSDTTLQQVIAAYAMIGDRARRADRAHHTGPHQGSIPTWARPATTRFAGNAPDQPPIQAGPVRWHGSHR
jgi:curved DNA-binding protein CbpA